MWCRGASRSALTRIALQFGDHDHLYARFDLAVDLDGHLVRTQGLYGLFEPDTASVEADTAGPPHHVGQQRHLTGAFDRRGGLPLVLRTQARNPAGSDPATVGYEPPQQVVVLVVDVSDVLLAEHARLALRRSPSSGRPVPSPTHSLPPD